MQVPVSAEMKKKINKTLPKSIERTLESNEKIFFALFTFEVQIFQLLQNFLAAKPIRFLFMIEVTWSFYSDQDIFFKMVSPQFD